MRETGLEMNWFASCSPLRSNSLSISRDSDILVPSLIHVDMVDQKMLETTYDAKNERDESRFLNF